MIAALALLALQDSPAASAPASPALLDRIDRARGAKRPDSLSMKGKYRLALSGASIDKPWEGPVEIDFSGDRVYERMDYGAQGLMQRGWSGPVTWEMHPVSGVRIYRGADESVMRRCLLSIYWPGWRALYRGAETAGAESLNGRPHLALKMLPEIGKPDVWHLDQETFLPSRIDFVISFNNEEVTIRVEFSDWRPVAGFLVAHKERTTMGTTWGDVVYESIAANAPIDAARFALPAEVAEAAATKEEGGFQVAKTDEQPTAVIRVKAKREEISRTLAVVLPEVMAHLTESGARTAGAPFTRYHGESNGVIDLEAGLPVAEKIAGKGRVQASSLPAGRAAAAWHLGPYGKLAGTYAKLEAWMKAQKLEAAGGPWEVYWTDPGLEPDSSMWRTQILWPVK